MNNTILKYDSNGNKVESSKYNSRGLLESKFNYKYSSKNRLVEEMEYEYSLKSGELQEIPKLKKNYEYVEY